MTYQRPAYEEVKIAHGGNTVTLRPSLRAATTLEARYGFPALYQALTDQNLTVISEIILVSSISRKDAAAFLSLGMGKPLYPFFAEVIGPLVELLDMFRPDADPNAKQVASKGKSIPWAEAYASLFNAATGWLDWTPETAWNATPNEIARAYAAHMDKLKAIYGSGEEQPEQISPDPDLGERMKAEGLDPEFDRDGLRALKMQIARGK